LEPIGQKRAILNLFLCIFNEIASFCENSRVVGISTVSDMSAGLGVIVVACIIAGACPPANGCVPDVASNFAAAGIPLDPDVLIFAGFPAFVGVPGVVSLSAVDFIPAIADISAVAVFPAVDGVCCCKLPY
jgi:hypothetical protein